MKIGKVQGFLQGFLRACKKHFDEKRSESGLWDEFIARICQDYAEESGDPYLEELSAHVQEVNIVFFKIPVKFLKIEPKGYSGNCETDVYGNPDTLLHRNGK